MTAHPVLLQKKYCRIIELLAKEQNISLFEAMKQFYESFSYGEIRQGISDMHCRSDFYLAEEILQEKEMENA